MPVRCGAIPSVLGSTMSPMTTQSVRPPSTPLNFKVNCFLDDECLTISAKRKLVKSLNCRQAEMCEVVSSSLRSLSLKACFLAIRTAGLGRTNLVYPLFVRHGVGCELLKFRCRCSMRVTVSKSNACVFLRHAADVGGPEVAPKIGCALRETANRH